MAFDLRSADAADRAAVEDLLTAADLPLDGLDLAWPHMVVAAADRVLGAAAVERYDRAGLLRSVVVAEDHRARGLGEALVRAAIGAAARAGVTDIWLLTFVPEWFERLGFERIQRASAPAAVQASAEFASACPDTAVAMRRAAWKGDAVGDADPRRPLGAPVFETLDEPGRAARITTLAGAPDRLRAAVRGLDDGQLDTPYRDGGWTLRQVVHHLADAHMNGAQRLRLALTEDVPTIRTYEEAAWGELADARTEPLEPSLAVFAGLHRRMVALLRALPPGRFSARFLHPESGERDLDWWLQLYAWHGAHHIAQIEGLRARRGW